MRFLFLFLACLVGGGCQWEGDEALRPSTRVAYLLSRDRQGHHITRHAGDTIALDWQSQLGLEPATTGGLDGREDELWVGGEQVLFRLSAAGTLRESYDLDSLQAHFLKWGDRTLLLCDTVQGRLGFFDPRQETLAVRKLDSVSGQPRYKGGQFYVPARRSVWVWQERAYAPLAQVDFAQLVVGLQPDQRAGVEVYTGSRDSLFSITLDYNGHRLLGEEMPLNARKERISPYRQAYYGQENTRSLRLNRNGRISGFSDISDFEYDFFQRVLYLIQGDSLLIHSQLEGTTRRRVAKLGAWQHAWYHRAAMVD